MRESADDVRLTREEVLLSLLCDDVVVSGACPLVLEPVAPEAADSRCL